MESEEFKIKEGSKLQTNMVCSNCLKFLNVEPINCIVDAFSIKVICGRCSEVNNNSTKSNKLRQYTYESIAHFFNFPCCNKEYGCEMILNWDNVLEHEIYCRFQKVVCPLSYAILFPEETSCSWKGNANTLNEHIENAHKDSILNPAEINGIGKNKSNSIFFTKVGSQIITVVIKNEMEKSKSFCLLMVNGTDIESQCFRYQLEISDENKDHSVMLCKNRLQSLFKMLDHIERYDTMVEIDTNRLRDLLKTSDNIIAKFEVIMKNKDEIPQNHQLLDGQMPSPLWKEIIQEIHHVDDQLLQELECPVCHDFMIPPIYICNNGHSLCGTCKPKVKECPSCRGVMSTTRNIGLEKLTTRVYYPCCNREEGCAVITTSKAIRQHEEICRFSQVKCILSSDCSHKCLAPSMMEHVADKHNDDFVVPDEMNICNVKVTTASVSVLNVLGELFRFTINGCEQNAYTFQLYHLCIDDDNVAKFQYNLTVSNPSVCSKSMNLTNVCPIWTSCRISEPLVDIVPWDLLKSFIHEGTFSYKVSIIKN